uniref:Uncharacterized protein n=1 Tax=Avena sativa TaxID=4498 RepID=A0ACD5XAX7_AVESA
MVNWVKVYRKHVLALVAKHAGLRQHAVDVDDAGTVINFWLPRHKQAQEEKKKQITKHPVVLVHGFAGDGIMTWWLQVGALSRRGYDVYVPDLIHFGGSTSPSPDRSVGFQAGCLAAALQKLGVAACDVVGFSYGGLVAFEMAAVHPDLVRSVVVSGAGTSFTDAAVDAMLGRFGAKTITELMLPESVEGVRSLLSIALHMKLWFPRRFLEDFLKVMFTNRKERGEMLEEMVIRDKRPTPAFHQNIFLLWGEHDSFVPIEDANSLKEELGKKATLRSISKAGHLAHLERPLIYNRCLTEFLAHVNAQSS